MTFQAAAECIMPALRLAAVMMLRVSLDGQMSAAPALRASVHISSSASRCVHTIPTPGNSLESLCTSEIDARSMSTIATSARCLATLERKSSSDGAMWTERNELHKEDIKDCVSTGSLWRRTTLENGIFPSEISPSSAVYRLHPLHGVITVQTFKITSDDVRRQLPACRRLFSQGLEWLGLELPILLQQNFHLAFSFLEFLAA